MKTKIVLGLLLPAVSMLFSCQKEAEIQETKVPEGELLEITATWAEGEDGSRTALQADMTSIWWTPGDEINVFYGSTASGKFTSTNIEPQATATFQGALSAYMGPQGSSSFWAVYPYNADNTCDGQSVTIAIPAEQTSVAGGFADKFFPAVATGTSTHLAFWNVCGGARFSVSGRGIEKVIFTSANGSPICGKVKVGFNANGKPFIASIEEGSPAMTVLAPEGGFIPGVYYYATMLPQTHAQGIEFSFWKSGWNAAKSFQGSITVSRSVFGNLDVIDSGLVFQPTDDPIDFSDSRVKTDCVAAFDTNGDGELSYAEAAAVTSLEGTLTSKLYTSFDELRFFCSVTEIPEAWFKNRVRLRSIRFPVGLERIGAEAFSGCTALTALELPVSLGQIGASAFAGCTAIKSIALGGEILSSVTVKSIFPDAYLVIKDLEILSSDEDYTFCDEVLSGCSNISEITLSEGLTAIGKGAFSGCNKLKTINIPSLGMWIDIAFSDVGASPFYSSQEGHLFVDGTEVTEISLPEGMLELGAYNFFNCSGICSVSFPSSVKSIGEDAFTGCTALNRADISDIASWINIDLSNKGSVPFCAHSGSLYLSGDIVRTIEIPVGTASINKYCFYNCDTIEEVIFPKSLKTIGEDGFKGCTALRKVVLPSTSQWLEMSYANAAAAPFNASGKGHLFVEGDEVKNYLIPEEVEEISHWAFYNCTGLRRIILEPVFPPLLGEGALDGTVASIHVWRECLDMYKSAWSDFANRIYPISEDSGEDEDIFYGDMVDLGLSVKWATCNLGAVNPEDYGDYYAWGELETKTSYSWSKYEWCNGSKSSLTKYNTNSQDRVRREVTLGEGTYTW